MSGAGADASWRRFWRVVAIQWIFILVGPPVGTLFFMLATALLGMGTGADVVGLSWIAVFALIYGLPFGYFVGIWPAAATGLAIGIRQIYFGGASLMFAVFSAALICIGFLLVTGQAIGTQPPDAMSPFPGYGTLMMVTCIASTLVCWSIVRSWHGSLRRAEGTA